MKVYFCVGQSISITKMSTSRWLAFKISIHVDELIVKVCTLCYGINVHTVYICTDNLISMIAVLS